MEITVGNILYLIIVASFIKFGKFLIKADDSKINSAKSEEKKQLIRSTGNKHIQEFIKGRIQR